MSRRTALFLAALCLALATPVAAAPRVKVVKISVTNPDRAPRSAQPVVVRVADVKRVAPDFAAGTVVVTATNAATLDEDSRVLETTELPSQADDLDGDG